MLFDITGFVFLFPPIPNSGRLLAETNKQISINADNADNADNVKFYFVELVTLTNGCLLVLYL